MVLSTSKVQRKKSHAMDVRVHGPYRRKEDTTQDWCCSLESQWRAGKIYLLSAFCPSRCFQVARAPLARQWRWRWITLVSHDYLRCQVFVRWCWLMQRWKWGELRQPQGCRKKAYWRVSRDLSSSRLYVSELLSGRIVRRLSTRFHGLELYQAPSFIYPSANWHWRTSSS